MLHHQRLGPRVLEYPTYCDGAGSTPRHAQRLQLLHHHSLRLSGDSSQTVNWKLGAVSIPSCVRRWAIVMALVPYQASARSVRVPPGQETPSFMMRNRARICPPPHYPYLRFHKAPPRPVVMVLLLCPESLYAPLVKVKSLRPTSLIHLITASQTRQ